MTPAERLAALTALQKAVAAELDGARADADEELLAKFAYDGVTRRDLRLGGAKVGEHALTFSKGGWEIEDRAALESFALDYGFASTVRSIRPWRMAEALDVLAEELPDALEESVRLDQGWEEQLTRDGAAALFRDSGLEVPGVRWRPEAVRGTQVRGCRPGDVLPALRSMGGADALLLGPAD